jgi:hypothetical protein
VPDPLKCIAYGPGLEKAEVGYPAEFTVRLKNAAGDNINVGGENVDIQIKVPPSPVLKKVAIYNPDCCVLHLPSPLSPPQGARLATSTVLPF